MSVGYSPFSSSLFFFINFVFVKKKSETELTASALIKNSPHTKAEVERLLIGEDKTSQIAFVLYFTIKKRSM